jgi:hypothetical protein
VIVIVPNPIGAAEQTPCNVQNDPPCIINNTQVLSTGKILRCIVDIVDILESWQTANRLIRKEPGDILVHRQTFCGRGIFGGGQNNYNRNVCTCKGISQSAGYCSQQYVVVFAGSHLYSF